MNIRLVSATLDDILSLVSCAEDYGFSHPILLGAFRNIIDGRLSNQEIENYARGVADKDGYGEEDYIEIKMRLKDFKQKYRL